MALSVFDSSVSVVSPLFRILEPPRVGNVLVENYVACVANQFPFQAPADLTVKTQIVGIEAHGSQEIVVELLVISVVRH